MGLNSKKIRSEGGRWCRREEAKTASRKGRRYQDGEEIKAGLASVDDPHPAEIEAYGVEIPQIEQLEDGFKCCGNRMKLVEVKTRYPPINCYECQKCKCWLRYACKLEDEGKYF